jgi:hypothetical protein
LFLWIFVTVEAAKVRPHFSPNYGGTVTNPFMVTSAFTIFIGIETMFIRVLWLVDRVADRQGR